MLQPIGPIDSLVYSTTRIVTPNSVGTGFFFQFPAPNGRVLLSVITNKHVVQNSEEATFQFHLSTDKTGSTPSGNFYGIKIQNLPKALRMHPDPEVDLCAIPILPCLEKVEQDTGYKPFIKTVQTDIILENQELLNLVAVEEVLMVGYPDGLWDEYNNYPLIRKGITATHPGINFRNKYQGVVDIACFHGSSGSPIYIYNPMGYLNKNNNSIEMGASRFILLGILAAGPQITADGTIETREIPTVKEFISKTNLMMHLGYYIKARELKILGESIKY